MNRDRPTLAFPLLLLLLPGCLSPSASPEPRATAPQDATVDVDGGPGLIIDEGFYPSRDSGELPDAADVAPEDPALPTAAAAYLFCGELRPGCWPPDTAPCPTCPLLGCRSPLPDPPTMVLVELIGGGVRLHLPGAAPELRLARLSAGWDEDRLAFELHVIGQAVRQCELFGLPTNAIRYAVRCTGGGDAPGAAILEDRGEPGCPACPPVAGCYQIYLPRIPGETCLLPCPSLDATVWLDQRGCRLVPTGLVGPQPEEFQSWVEPDGTLSLSYLDRLGFGMACVAPAAPTGYQNLLCTEFLGGRAPNPITGTLVRVEDARCGQ